MNTTKGAGRQNNGITDDGTVEATQLMSDDVAADRGRNQWSTGDLLSPDRNHAETGFAFGGARIESSRTSWNAGHPVVADRYLHYFVLERQRRDFEFEKQRQRQQFEERKQRMEEERRSAESHVRRAAEDKRQHLEELRRRMDEER